MNKVRVLIAEDHETVREGLKLILNGQSDIEVVGEASDGQSAIEQAKHLKPDLVLMDVSMPRMNGIKATQKLKETFPNIHVLILTRHKDGYFQQLLRAGASGYVLKQSASSELLHAIRSIAMGGKYLDPAVAGKVMGTFKVKPSTPFNLSRMESLSEREAEVLRLISLGYSNKDIAAQLDLSIKTIEAHKSNGMKKLGMHSRIDIVRYAVLQGWLEDSSNQ